MDILIDAITNINIRYCCHEDSNNNLVILNERSFAYELYRVWQTILESKGVGLIVNAEVPKIIEKEFKKKCIELFEEDHKRFYPDLVLHKSNWESDHQEIICEIKLSNNMSSESLKKDLKKLIAYTSENVVLYHAFKQAVFILVNGSDNDIRSKILENEYKDYIESPITCLFVNIKEGRFHVEKKTLCEVLG